MKKNKITFWGVRGSFPTPDQDKMKVGGHTSCVSIETEKETLIMDMGTGIKNLGEKIVSNPKSPSKINIFLSHYHWDHIIGLPVFAPLFSDKYEVNLYRFATPPTPARQPGMVWTCCFGFFVVWLCGCVVVGLLGCWVVLLS